MSKTKREHAPAEAPAAELTHDGPTYSPRFDIFERPDELVLLADVPGVAVEDVDIQFEDGQLTLHGKVAERNQGRQFLGGEYGIGDFHRAFTIGQEIDPRKISAELKDGVLKLHLPKSDKVKSRRIEVGSG